MIRCAYGCVSACSVTGLTLSIVPPPVLLLTGVLFCVFHVHRDLDLLRDAGLTCADPAQRWKCKHCSNRINTEEIENR
jgi:hypothetical protein